MNDAPFKTYNSRRAAAHQFRHLRSSRILPQGRVAQDNATLINFASNDYLGLSQHPALIAASKKAIEEFGTGTTASRLITGNHPLYEKIETTLTHGKGTEAALVLNSGYQANVTLLPALADAEVIGKPVTILADRLSHNSLLQGAMLSGAKRTRFQHNDLDHLETLLKHEHEKNTQSLIVTESVFGMDGDRADLATLTALAARYNAMLYVDEAHATGVYGQNGFGLCADYAGEIDIVMGTFGKALGSFGAYIGCSRTLRDYFIQRCGGLIYSTALPPANLAAMLAALDLLPTLDNERATLLANATHLRTALQTQGWNCGTSTTHIIPIILGDEEAATKLSAALRANGILAPAIRPPTVPAGTSRLRLSLSAAHSTADIDHLIDTLSKYAPEFAQAA